MKDPEILDPDWSRYPSTVLAFAGEGEGEVSLDLRRPCGAREIQALAGLGLDRPFAVITAHDPRGEDLAGGENERRAARLNEELRARDVGFIPVNACSPDADHCEASVAVKMSYASARQLARDHGQVAFFWFDGKRFWIAGGLVETDPIALPRGP